MNVPKGSTDVLQEALFQNILQKLFKNKLKAMNIGFLLLRGISHGINETLDMIQYETAVPILISG